MIPALIFTNYPPPDRETLAAGVAATLDRGLPGFHQIYQVRMDLGALAAALRAAKRRARLVAVVPALGELPVSADSLDADAVGKVRVTLVAARSPEPVVTIAPDIVALEPPEAARLRALFWRSRADAPLELNPSTARQSEIEDLRELLRPERQAVWAGRRRLPRELSRTGRPAGPRGWRWRGLASRSPKDLAVREDLVADRVRRDDGRRVAGSLVPLAL